MSKYSDGYYNDITYSDYWQRQREDDIKFAVDALTKGEKMKTNEELMAERDKLLLRAAELEKRVAQRETYGNDPFKNGDMLKIMITYPPSDTSYTYVGVKIRNKFYLSGKVQSRSFVDQRDTSNINVVPATTMGWTWNHFVAWLASGNASVWVVEKIKKVL